MVLYVTIVIVNLTSVCSVKVFCRTANVIPALLMIEEYPESMTVRNGSDKLFFCFHLFQALSWVTKASGLWWVPISSSLGVWGIWQRPSLPTSSLTGGTFRWPFLVLCFCSYWITGEALNGLMITTDLNIASSAKQKRHKLRVFSRKRFFFKILKLFTIKVVVSNQQSWVLF